MPSANLELGRRVAEQVIARANSDGSDAVWTGTVPTGPRPPALLYDAYCRSFMKAEQTSGLRWRSSKRPLPGAQPRYSRMRGAQRQHAHQFADLGVQYQRRLKVVTLIGSRHPPVPEHPPTQTTRRTIRAPRGPSVRYAGRPSAPGDVAPHPTRNPIKHHRRRRNHPHHFSTPGGCSGCGGRRCRGRTWS